MSLYPPPNPPPPPQLPNSTADWNYYARSTAYVLDGRSGRFGSRWLTPSDPDFGPYDDTGDEPLLRLGAPSSALTWPYVINRWGLQVLNAAGFINCPSMPGEFANQSYNPQGRLHKHRADSPIHPVLRRDMWLNLKDEEWNLIQPSLYLATAMLDEPDILSFFAVFFNSSRVEHSSRLKKDITIIEHPPFTTNEQLEYIYNAMVDMRGNTSFEFTDQDPKEYACYGSTGPKERNLASENPDARVSDIHISVCHLNALRRHQDPIDAKKWLNYYMDVDQVDPERRIELDPASSKLRVFIVLATTILHELTHAFRQARFGLEPYIADERIAEEGFAFEKWMYGGALVGPYSPDKTLNQKFGLERQIHSPYGLELKPDPTATWTVRAREERLPHHWAWPIQAHWVASLFARQFWEIDVRRYGAKAIQCKRANGWGVTVKSY